MVKMLEVKGVKQTIDKMRNHRPGFYRKVTVGLKRVALFLQRESQKLVPIDTGALRNSAFVRAIREGTPFVLVEVGYSMYYAIYVHEDLDARHKPGKQAKYLEQPLREKRGEMQVILVEAVR